MKKCICGLLTVFLFLLGCVEPFQEDPLPSTWGRVIISQEESNGRTIFPNAPEFVSYMLHFQYQGGGEASKNSQETTSLPCVVGLDPGPWLIRVVAYTRIEGIEGLADGNYPVASGNSTVNVGPGDTVPVTVNLQRDGAMTGQGVLEYEIGLAENGIGGAVLRVLNMDKSQTASRNLLEAASGRITLDAGYYLLQVQVSTGRIRSKTELIHIYSGHTTRVAGSAWNFDIGEEIFFNYPENIVVINATDWSDVKTFIRGGGNDRAYTINISGDIGVAGSTANTFGTATGITVTLTGNGKLYLTSRGRIITLADDQTLIIDSAGLTLQGLKNGQNDARQNNNASLVYVNGSNAKLELRNGTISGNTSSSDGGGVYVDSNATCTMNGGTISGNTASSDSMSGTASSSGGGVYVAGTFTMNGGEINGNSISASISGSGTASFGSGGGVYVAGTFTMNGGEISDNSASAASSVSINGLSSASSSGGGVHVAVNATFTMNSGAISGNSASASVSSGGTTSSSGGGVYVAANATFTMNDGEISDNSARSIRGTSSSSGGGVYVDGTFTMNDGEISGNSASAFSDRAYVAASSNGGGVRVAGNATFTMNSGAISGNSASATSTSNLVSCNGGGVNVANNATFYIVTGTVYGSDEEDLSNTAVNNGAALYNDGTAQHGTFNGETWGSNGDLSTTDDTINVVNGVLQ